jgi:hypothetical protein
MSGTKRHEVWSKDGKTFLSCGFGVPHWTCPCNGCRWEYGDPEMDKYPTLTDAMKDRSDEKSAGS